MSKRLNFGLLLVAGIGLSAIAPSPSFAESNRVLIKPINRPAFPLLSLPQNEASGQRAIDILGGNLPAVAQWYGHTEDEFRNLLLTDKASRIDGRGRLFYVDSTPEKLPLPTAPQGLIEGTALPLADTFKLHSKAGAKKTIYLNFNGGTLSSTAWASSTTATAPAYTIDADPAFSNTELTNIQAIWRQVAEDYAPFDVDVTTETPVQSAISRFDSNDDVYGTVALITTKNVYPTCGCGGIAYVGIYNMTSDYYKPALVFHDSLANTNKYIAEAISHEVGHNIGLSHDGYNDGTTNLGYYEGQGSGATGWAPIMGVGYYKALTQFSKGEYLYATQKQDDFVVAQSYGLPLRPLSEDVGDTIGTATTLTGVATTSGTQAIVDGVIETAADKDVYAFTTGGGAVAISLSPVTTSPNLDANIQLLNSNGQILAQSNPVDALNASLSITLPSGTYYVLVEGVGKGDPLTTGYSDFGSVGWYRVTATYPTPGAAAPVASFTATPTTGTAPLTVALDATSSSDPNGNDTISAFGWSYGDSTTGTGSITSKTFSVAGTYNVTLTVTDNTNLSSTTTKTIVVNPAVTLTSLSVASIGLTAKIQRNGTWYVTSAVTIRDANAKLVPSATVTGTWSGNVSQTSSAITNLTGVATFTSPLSKKTTGIITYTVNSVTAAGYTYNSAANYETSKSYSR